MKRIGYLKRALDASKMELGAAKYPTDALLKKVREEILVLNQVRSECYEKDILPALKAEGVHPLRWDDLDAEEKSQMGDYFHHQVFPVLTPLAVDPAHPFPFLSNLSLSLGIALQQPKEKASLFARIKIPNFLPQWIPVGKKEESGEHRFVRLIDVVQAHVHELFPEMIILGMMPFRVTRSVEIEEISDDVEDIMDLVEEELRQRRLAPVVRLEIGSTPNDWIKNILIEELELTEDDVYSSESALDYRSLGELTKINLPQLKYPIWTPVVPPPFSDENFDIFKTLRERDVLVHHPYESFSGTVAKFIREAAEDPDVLTIKLALYRTEEDSPLVPLLIRAAELGKQVVCVVELKARFDEAQNIYWGEMLEKAGVHVVYGVVGLKTHAKAALVVRKEANEFRLYAHVGTGNYNAETAKLYTDVGLLTSNPKITSELIEVFNYLTGLSLKKNYKKFLVAPINLKEKFLQFIDREKENKLAGRPALIVAKMNSLEDQEIIEGLYLASQAGVPIKLIVRGFCCLVPGVEGLSENIQVFSIIGRFLEHSRIFYFQNGVKNPRDGKFYIASADWMSRNLNNRVETAIPIDQKDLKERLWYILETQLGDYQLGWELQSDGKYVRRTGNPTESNQTGLKVVSTHERFMGITQKRSEKS